MLVYIFVHIVLYQIIFVQTIQHQKRKLFLISQVGLFVLSIFFYLFGSHRFNIYNAIAEKVWSVRCKKNDYVLNDCNWCWCGQNYRFQCKARVCEEVDAFGHFKDTIQELDVGMEGHGAWRSRPTLCTPGVQYQRGTVLCVCDENGSWPNPVCRDLFRILHSVEVTETAEESTSQSCSPSKLYLVACNTCFCPSSGKLDANLCTNRTCSDGDPVLEPKDEDVNFSEGPIKLKDVEEKSNVTNTKTKDAENEPSDTHAELNNSDTELIDANTESNDSTYAKLIFRKAKHELEIYATCSPKKTYTIGNQSCDCLTNNRLTCNDHNDHTTREKKVKQYRNIKSKRPCRGRVGSVVRIACNLCKCTSDKYMYCTTKKCISRNKGLSFVVKKAPEFKNLVRAPIDDMDCLPGTSYKQDCNKCFCMIEKGTKKFACTRQGCPTKEPETSNWAQDCIPDTTYKKPCLICNCEIIAGVKYETCNIDTKCWKQSTKKNELQSIESLNGYCEPRRLYTMGCNVCRCMSGGKLIRCTTRACATRSIEPIEVEIVPFQQIVSETCPKGHSYKVECNLCICLSNGNALCTSSDCSKQLE